MNEHTGKNILIRIKKYHNEWYLVLYNYTGRVEICDELLEAIQKESAEKGMIHRGLHCIEILQEHI